jgi:hypothetical protein
VALNGNGRGGGRNKRNDEDFELYAKIPAKQRQRFAKAFFYIVGAILPPLGMAAFQLERSRSCFADPTATHVWDCITYLPTVENWIYVAAVAALGLFLLLPVLFWDG